MSIDSQRRRWVRRRRRRKMEAYNERRSVLLAAVDDLMQRPVDMGIFDDSFYNPALGVPFDVRGTVTGRFSSKYPNFQNVPRGGGLPAGDIHSIAAKELGISRAQAKAMNFGRTYGVDVGRGKDMSTVVSAFKDPNGLMIVDEVHHFDAKYYEDIMKKMAASLQLPKSFIDGSMAVASSAAALRYAEADARMTQQLMQQDFSKLEQKLAGLSVQEDK